MQQAILAAAKLDASARAGRRGARPWKASRPGPGTGDARRLDADRDPQREGPARSSSPPAEAIWGADPNESRCSTSLQYTAAAGNAKTPGSFLRLITTAGGAQERRFVGGSQLVSEKLADRPGRRVVLRAPVRVVAQDGDGVRVVADGTTVEARHVILAVPPALAARSPTRRRCPRARPRC